MSKVRGAVEARYFVTRGFFLTDTVINGNNLLPVVHPRQMLDRIAVRYALRQATLARYSPLSRWRDALALAKCLRWGSELGRRELDRGWGEAVCVGN